jgi:hypothetical protein
MLCLFHFRTGGGEGIRGEGEDSPKLTRPGSGARGGREGASHHLHHQASPSWSSWSLLVLQPPPGFHHLLWGIYVLELLPDATQPPHALTMGNTFLPNPTYANQDQAVGVTEEMVGPEGVVAGPEVLDRGRGAPQRARQVLHRLLHLLHHPSPAPLYLCSCASIPLHLHLYT